MIWIKFVLAGFFIYAGVMHFVKPKFFLAIMPPYVPFHKEAVQISGVAEVLFGLGLLIGPYQNASAWGLILLLILVFPANVYMATSHKFKSMSPWIRWGRLPLQGLLIWWVYTYV